MSWSPDKIAQGDHNSSAPTCALHAISLLLTLGAGGALHTTTKCQDVVFLIVMFREGLHAHHAMQAIVVGVVGRSCCIVMIIKTSLHLVQNCIPFVWILLDRLLPHNASFLPPCAQETPKLFYKSDQDNLFHFVVCLCWTCKLHIFSCLATLMLELCVCDGPWAGQYAIVLCTC